MHLLIPFAASADPASRQVWRGLQLPQLQQLLRHLQPLPQDDTPTTDALVLPHERLHAAELGLAPQAPAWAALRARQLALPGAAGEGWAVLTPSHWQVGQAQVTLLAPEELALTDEESRALLAAMQPYFAEDGITLFFDSPTRWLARGEVFRGLATASPERAIGRDVAPWLPASPVLRRLQNEMQMLLYTHAVNEARTARRALAVNSFWISGSGALPDTLPAPTRPLVVPQGLMQAALRGDWPAWGRAWEQLDATDMTALRAALDAGAPQLQLTLCSEQRVLSYATAAPGLWRRISSLFGPETLSNLPNKL
jgi:hypothetical protein